MPGFVPSMFNPEPSLPAPLQRFLDRMTSHVLWVAGGVAVMMLLQVSWQMAYSVAVAAALFTWALRTQAKLLSSVLQDAGKNAQSLGASQSAKNSGREMRSKLMFQLPLLLLALAAVLWYTPAEPIGILVGVGCVLVCVVVAAIETNLGPEDLERELRQDPENHPKDPGSN